MIYWMVICSLVNTMYEYEIIGKKESFLFLFYRQLIQDLFFILLYCVFYYNIF